MKNGDQKKVILELKDIWVKLGGAVILKGITLNLFQNDLICVIGANGAGKSTLLKTISGLYPVSSGYIRLNGECINSLTPQKRVNLGIVHVPEGGRIFSGLSVYENLIVGGAHIRKDRSEIKQDLDKIYSYFPKLKVRYKQMAGTLSGGERQMLAIGRALMSKPKILMLDEPTAGMSPILFQHLSDVISKLNKEIGVSVILVEQNTEVALRLCRYGYVIEQGKIVIHQKTEDLRNNAIVKHSYLGLE